jgi:hypothetical protein
LSAPLVPRKRGESGQVLVEYAIVFPLQLVLTLAIIQLAHIFVAKQVISYAAYCAARAALVDEDPTTAACVPISRIAGEHGVTESTTFEVPVPGGTVPLPKFDAALEKTDVEQLSASNPGEIKYRVTHRYQLGVPVGGAICAYVAQLFVGHRPRPGEDLDLEFRSLEYVDYESYGSAHLRLRADCTLVRPWPED